MRLNESSSSQSAAIAERVSAFLCPMDQIIADVTVVSNHGISPLVSDLPYKKVLIERTNFTCFVFMSFNILHIVVHLAFDFRYPILISK